MFGFLPLVAVMAGAVAQDTDTTFAVSPGARLDVNAMSGEVVIRAWDRNELRIVADHSRSVRVEISSSRNLVRVRSRNHGMPSVDFEITVPATMDIEVDGTFLDVDVRGVRGSVTIGTIQGDVHLSGGSGWVALTSVQGDVEVEGSRGRIRATSSNGDVTVLNASGEIEVETINGRITLRDIESSSVSGTTVNGSVSYEGSVSGDGRYTFGTHNGDLTLVLPSSVSAAVSALTYHGTFEADFPVTLTETRTRGNRFSFVLGDGEARIELTSFGGTIRLKRRSR